MVGVILYTIFEIGNKALEERAKEKADSLKIDAKDQMRREQLVRNEGPFPPTQADE
jgi:hypothetical protein